MNNLLRAIFAVFLIAIITVCSILIINKISGRAGADLTEHKLYTLSGGTKNIIEKLAQPITLKLYYSRTAAMKASEGIRYYNNYYLYVKDLLEEYSAIGSEKIRFETIDPRPYSDEEEEAIRYGLKRFQITEDEGFFFGLAAVTELGKTKVIEFFAQDRQQFVEYDVSKLINDVTIREKKRVGVISSLDVLAPNMSPYMMQMMQMQGKEPPQPWTISNHLSDKYELQNIKPDEYEKVGKNFDYLMVIHPKDFPQEMLFAIDQFVMNGGRLMVFIDPHCINDVPEQNPQNPYAAMSYDAGSTLNELLGKWGVTMAKDLIAVDPLLAVKTPLQRNANPEPFLPFIQTTNKYVNSEQVIVSALHDIKFVFAGSLNLNENQGTKVTPLITTSEEGGSWRYSNKFELQRPDTNAILGNMIRSGKDTVLAAIITGKFTTNFPDGIDVVAKEDDEHEGHDHAKDEEKEEKDSKDESKHLDAVKESKGDAMVVVFSDVDFISDMIAYQQSFLGMSPAGDNANLMFNTLDFLSGSSDLISIRSRGNINREFTRVKEIEKDADEATAAEVEVINNKIANYRQRLNELGGSGEGSDEKLIVGKAMEERRKIQLEIRDANKALRELQAGKREKVEALKKHYENINQFLAPAIILLIAILLSIHRKLRARKYLTRRANNDR